MFASFLRDEMYLYTIGEVVYLKSDIDQQAPAHLLVRFAARR